MCVVIEWYFGVKEVDFVIVIFDDCFGYFVVGVVMVDFDVGVDWFFIDIYNFDYGVIGLCQYGVGCFGMFEVCDDDVGWMLRQYFKQNFFFEFRQVISYVYYWLKFGIGKCFGNV